MESVYCVPPRFSPGCGLLDWRARFHSMNFTCSIVWHAPPIPFPCLVYGICSRERLESLQFIRKAEQFPWEWSLTHITSSKKSVSSSAGWCLAHCHHLEPLLCLFICRQLAHGKRLTWSSALSGVPHLRRLDKVLPSKIIWGKISVFGSERFHSVLQLVAVLYLRVPVTGLCRNFRKVGVGVLGKRLTSYLWSSEH